MNRLHLPRYRQPPIRLADEGRFAHTKPPPAMFARDNPEMIVSRLTGRHCAGLATRAGGREVRDYLLGGRETTPELEWTVRSLLNACSVADAMHLIVLCQIPVNRLVRRVHALNVTNYSLIRFLNQFADPG